MCILYTIVLGHGLVAILHARHVARLSGTVTTWDILLQYNNKSPNLSISLHQFLFVAFAVAQLYVICLIACYYSISWRVVFSECTANNLLVCFLQQPCGTTFTNTCWDSVCVSVHLRDSLWARRLHWVLTYNCTSTPLQVQSRHLQTSTLYNPGDLQYNLYSVIFDNFSGTRSSL